MPAAPKKSVCCQSPMEVYPVGRQYQSHRRASTLIPTPCPLSGASQTGVHDGLPGVAKALEKVIDIPDVGRNPMRVRVVFPVRRKSRQKEQSIHRPPIYFLL